MRKLLVSMALVAALGLTGCGGGGDDDKAAATTSTAPPPTTVALGNDQANTQFCQLAKKYNEQYNSLLAAATDPVKLKAVTTDAESAIRQAQSTAPAEIKADVTVVATTAGQVLTVLQRNNFDVSKSPEVGARLQDPAFQAALANVQRYGRAHCGIA